MRNVWRLYGGWHDGNPANLKPAPRGRDRGRSSRRSPAAPAGSRQRARELADAGDLRLAGHLAEWAALADARRPGGARHPCRRLRTSRGGRGLDDEQGHVRRGRARLAGASSGPRRRGGTGMKIAGSTILVTGASVGHRCRARAAARASAARPSASSPGAPSGSSEVLARCREHAPESRAGPADLGDLERAEQVALEAVGRVRAPRLHREQRRHRQAQARRSRSRSTTCRRRWRMNFTVADPHGDGVAPPHARARGSGLVVNVSSMGGRLGIVHEAAYCAAKFAHVRLERVGPHRPRRHRHRQVKLVLPGPIATEIWEQQPGELPGLYDGPFVTAADCAADIVPRSRATASSSTRRPRCRAGSATRRRSSSARRRTSTPSWSCSWP